MKKTSLSTPLKAMLSSEQARINGLSACRPSPNVIANSTKPPNPLSEGFGATTSSMMRPKSGTKKTATKKENL